MSKVQPRGEISPFTAAVVTFVILAASGASVWRYVIRDTAAVFAAPATQTEQIIVPGTAGYGLYPEPHQTLWISPGFEPLPSAEDK